MPQAQLAGAGWTEAALTVALKNRYAGEAHAFLPQVANGTGGNKSRTADALVMSLWPSRGLDLFGFEIKISRNDWLQELKRPQKAETIGKYCDFWYLVVADAEIVRPGELPGAWGLMAPKGKALRIMKEAIRTEAVPIGRVFLAALLRNAAAAIVPRAEIAEELAQAREEGERRGKETHTYRFQQLEREVAQLRHSVLKFEEASGVKIDSYNGERLGKAVKLIAESALQRHVRTLEAFRRNASQIITEIDSGLAAFKNGFGA